MGLTKVTPGGLHAPATLVGLTTAAKAKGDSIMRGYTSDLTVTPGTNNYAALLATDIGWSLTNGARDTTEVWDQANDVFTEVVSDSLLSLYAIGSNDMRRWGATTDAWKVFRDALLAEMVWLAIPETSKIMGKDATSVGTWTPLATYRSPANMSAYSSSAGATKTAIVVGRTVYVCLTTNISEPGTTSIAIDGVSYGSIDNAPVANVMTSFSRAYGPKLVRISGLSDAPHTVVVTAGGQSSGITRLDYIAGSGGGIRSVSGPRLFQGGIPRATAAGYVAAGGSDAAVATYNNVIRECVRLLADDGLNITFVSIAHVLDLATDFDGGGFHPNIAGHAKIAAVWAEALNPIRYPRDRTPAGIWSWLAGVGAGAPSLPAVPGQIYFRTDDPVHWAYRCTEPGAPATFLPIGTDPTVPGAPTIGTASPSASGTASVAFTVPALTGGSPITGYTATSSPGGITASGTSSPVTVPGLTNGTNYTFTVHATNAIGNSAESAASNTVIPGGFPTLSGLVLRWRADDEPGADASVVSPATDQSGSSHPGVAGGAGSVTLRTNQVNGRKVYRFPGNAWLTAAFTLNAPVTVFIVLKRTGNTGAAVDYHDGGAALNLLVLQKNAADNWAMYGGSFVTDGAADLNFHTLIEEFAGANAKLWVDGGATVTGNSGNGNPGGVTLGAAFGGAAPSLSDVAEIAVWNRVLTVAEANQLGLYSSVFYAQTWTTAT